MRSKFGASSLSPERREPPVKLSKGRKFRGKDRGTSFWPCQRCGCAPGSHAKGGCMNYGCTCPKAVQACARCGNWKWCDQIPTSICGDCRQIEKEEEQAWKFQEWVLTLPERVQEERRKWQIKQLKAGRRTLHQLRQHLREAQLSQPRG